MVMDDLDYILDTAGGIEGREEEEQNPLVRHENFDEFQVPILLLETGMLLAATGS